MIKKPKIQTKTGDEVIISNTNKIHKKKKLYLKNNFLFIGFLVILFVLVFGLIYSLFLYNKEKNKNEVLGLNIENNTKSNPDKVIQSFKKIYEIDTDPIIYKISNIDDLKKQDDVFYKNAVNGDYIIILEDKKIAILYRLEEDKIINISIVNITPQSTKPNN